MDSSVPPSPPKRPSPVRVPMNFRILALLWVMVSIPAVFLLLWEPGWFKAGTAMGRLRALRLEQWLALVLLALQVYWLIRARQERDP